MPPVRFTEVYRAGPQSYRVRFVQALALAGLLGALWAAGTVWRPAPPEPLIQRRAWAVGCALIGLAFAGGMLYYGRVYVAHVAFDAVQARFLITTIGPFRYRLAVPEAALDAAFHAGQMTTPKHRVQAPWYTPRVPGALPLILDAQGDVLDAPLWQRLTPPT